MEMTFLKETYKKHGDSWIASWEIENHCPRCGEFMKTDGRSVYCSNCGVGIDGRDDNPLTMYILYTPDYYKQQKLINRAWQSPHREFRTKIYIPCPSCGQHKSYLMTDYKKIWCPDCDFIVDYHPDSEIRQKIIEGHLLGCKKSDSD